MKKFEGQVIKISPSSTQYINPMDINANYSEEDNPIALKADFILSLCELIVGGKEGLQPVEKTVIDRCVHQIYQTYFENPVPENMPVLQDLYEALLRQDEKEAHHVATALEIYVTGSLNLFNHPIYGIASRFPRCKPLSALLSKADGTRPYSSGWLYRHCGWRFTPPDLILHHQHTDLFQLLAQLLDVIADQPVIVIYVGAVVKQVQRTGHIDLPDLF